MWYSYFDRTYRFIFQHGYWSQWYWYIFQHVYVSLVIPSKIVKDIITFFILFMSVHTTCNNVIFLKYIDTFFNTSLWVLVLPRKMINGMNSCVSEIKTVKKCTVNLYMFVFLFSKGIFFTFFSYSQNWLVETSNQSLAMLWRSQIIMW